MIAPPMQKSDLTVSSHRGAVWFLRYGRFREQYDRRAL
jgi:hypothetical protein